MSIHDDDEPVSFLLIDFVPVITDQIDKLKTMFRNPKIPFSYRFDNCRQIGNLEIEEMTRYDFKLSYRYDCLVGITTNSVYIIDRKMKILLNSFALEGSLIHTLDDDHDEIYNISPSESNADTILLNKYHLGEFIKGKNLPEPVYSSEAGYSNPFGMVVFNGKNTRFLIVLDDFASHLKITDCETGCLITNTILTISPDACALELISRSEIMIGCSGLTSIYEIDENLFGLGKEALKLIVSMHTESSSSDFYSIVHDELNRKIMVSDAEDNTIIVLRKDDLQLVQKQKCNDNISGMCLDKQTGELFVCYEKGLVVYQ
ncbi:predicted protein [Naegleria gruberi]|uniref:Predicted protein n=1 Tax=Naegleria gruberi TaxID=5762 RepID=D2VET5_NAEGR|nr:uncharacterized protein NAEGRDRAFT_48953 [Naegleria gruberi]EFC44659.1 predicted protein [Naegleria gruberi]|eukprot:XP_002677403.1 predicted protein [Naegleria gruberi strain NEG-M]